MRKRNRLFSLGKTVLVRKVYLRKARIFSHGIKSGYIESFTDTLHGNCDFHIYMDGKYIRDRHECLQCKYNAKTCHDTRLLSLSGVLLDMKQLLSIVQEKRREQVMQERTRSR